MTKDEALKQALEAIKDLLDQTETPPNKNCSCHIAPPCSDCVDYSGVRYAIEQANKAITAIKEALAQPETGMLHIDRLDQWLDASLKERKQRTWVGLTLEDMETTHWSPDFRAGAKWAAAKLKAKNT